MQMCWGESGWLRHAATVAAALGLGSMFNVGCDRRQAMGTPVAPMPGPTRTMGIVAAPPMGKIAPPEVMQGDVEPATQPTTRSAKRVVLGEVEAPAGRTPSTAPAHLTSPYQAAEGFLPPLDDD